MNYSENALTIIKQFEGLRFKAYKDPGSKNGLPITIGYGSTTHLDGSNIKLGEVITLQQALAMLGKEVTLKANFLASLGLKLNQNQFDSLTSFIYNIGTGAFSRSTMYNVIKANPNNPNIKDQFNKWIFNDGKVLQALVTRRKQESDLYFKK